MLEYPKIETLYNRDKETFTVNTELRLPEFGLIRKWYVTEKIHGQNVRVEWDGENVRFAGRSSEDPKDLHKDLLAFMESTFTVELLKGTFGAQQVMLYGEGCGAGIQRGGGAYSTTKTFVLFDILINGYWLEPENLAPIAEKFGVKTAPFLGLMSEGQIFNLVRNGTTSVLAAENTLSVYQAEGIIARTVPGLTTKHGTRLIFKLKTSDFPAPVSSQR